MEFASDLRSEDSFGGRQHFTETEAGQKSAADLQAEAVGIARQADAVIAVVGITPELENEEADVNAPGFFGGDRVDLKMPEPQEELLQALAATGKPLIVVLTSGSALAVNWAQGHASAILEAWYPGEEGGTAVADVLAGDYSPSGRLPVTFYTSIAQLPPFTDYGMSKRTYRYFSGTPLYPFGFGLSYASFAYSGARVDSSQVAANQPVTVSVDVQNTGSVAADEVVQVLCDAHRYCGGPDSCACRVYTSASRARREKNSESYFARARTEHCGRGGHEADRCGTCRTLDRRRPARRRSGAGGASRRACAI